MVTLETPICDFGKPAIDFKLLGVDGKTWTLTDCMGEKGLLVMFICNHCPYVKAVKERIVRDTNELKSLGINSVAIMSNDFVNYPDDSFENMKLWSDELNFSFPYLLDETQEVAKNYGAICTPDFLVTTRILNCNIADAWIQVAVKLRQIIRPVICLRR